MSWNDMFALLYDNPVSRTVTSTVSTVMKQGSKYVVPSSTPPPVTIVTEKTPLWKLAAEQGPFVRIAGLMGASAVILGAYGAHKSYPKEKQEELKAIFETANRFHFLHSLVLLGLPLTRNPLISGSLMLSGTFLFAGPCYYHAFTGENKFGKFAPIGGTILIVAWLSMAL